MSVIADQLRFALLPKRVPLHPSSIGDEISTCLGIVGEMQASDTSIGSWVTFRLLSRTGESVDHSVGPYAGEPRRTEYYAKLPRIAAAVEDLRDDGFDVDYAGVAVITGRGMLRPHVDNYISIRLIVPLTEQGDDFRHLFHDRCVVMRQGELWSVRPQTCHGAANVAEAGFRVALLVDARLPSTVLPAWCPAAPGVPADRLFPRQPWNATSRAEVEAAARARLGAAESEAIDGRPVLSAEEEWLFAPFAYALAADAAYHELTAFLERVAGECDDEPGRTFWTGRAEHWRANNCVGAPAKQRIED